MREGPGIKFGYVSVREAATLSHAELADVVVSTGYSNSLSAQQVREEAARRLRALAVLVGGA